MDKIKALYGIFSLFFLFIGFGIYILFRDLNNIVLLNFISIPSIFKSEIIYLKLTVMNNFIKFHLPDAFWFLSGILFFRFIWFNKIREQKKYLFYFLGIGLLIEISQLSEKIYGTFDWFDLFFMCIVAVIEGFLYKYFVFRRIV